MSAADKMTKQTTSRFSGCIPKKNHTISWKPIPETFDSTKPKQTFIEKVDVKIYKNVVDVDDFYIERKLRKGKIWTKFTAKLDLHDRVYMNFQCKKDFARINVATISNLLQNDHWKSKHYFRFTDKNHSWVLKFKTEQDRDRFAQTVFWKRITTTIIGNSPSDVLDTVEQLLSYVGNLAIFPHILRMETLKLMCSYLNTETAQHLEEYQVQQFIAKLYQLTGRNNPNLSFCNLMVNYLRGSADDAVTVECITEIGKNIFSKLCNIDDSPWLRPLLIEIFCFLGRGGGQHSLREFISAIAENHTSPCGENLTRNVVKLVACGVNLVYTQGGPKTNTSYSNAIRDAEMFPKSQHFSLEISCLDEGFQDVCKPLMIALNCLCFDETWCRYVAKAICRVPFISGALKDEQFLLLALPTILDLIDCKQYSIIDCLWHEHRLGWMDVFSPDKTYLKDCRLKRGAIFLRILERLTSPGFRTSYVPQFLVEVRKYYFEVLCDPRFENEIGVIYTCAKLLKFTNVVQPERNLLYSRLIATKRGREVLLEMKIDGIELEDCEQTSFDTAF